MIPIAMLIVVCCTGGEGAAPGDTPPTPGEAVADLLSADRAFSAAGGDVDATDAIAAMLDEDVILMVPGGFAEGRAAAVSALADAPGGAGARIEWVPVRGGISADGQHGFTYGYMTLRRADGTRVPLKYLSYWIRQPEGWRVAAYKRRPRVEGEVSLEMLPPALPGTMVAPLTDIAATAVFAENLRAAEQAFSDEAQRVGLGRAFARHGSEDAMNMGGPTDVAFVFGAARIGAGMGLDSVASPLNWSADRVLVASSGDMGITFGMIRLNEAPADPAAPASFPFFTVWRRAGPNEPWRYVAE